MGLLSGSRVCNTQRSTLFWRTAMPSGRRLHASHRRVEVKVTKKHIETAKPSDSAHCMIADAIAEAEPHAKFISVDLSTIRFTDSKKKQRYIYLTPALAQVSLVRFDQGLEVAPFSFGLHAPAQVVVAQTGQKTTGKRPSEKRQGVRKPQGGSIPVRLGGRVPPKATLGKKRQFGLRVTSAGRKLPPNTDY